jgi:diguanylate cyclase (GGDEF)-like protein
MLPGMSGPEICRKLREEGSENRPYQYIILLTVREGQENIVEGLDSGADDYVTKPFDYQELRLRIRAGERILYLQDQLRKAALEDPLTGLPNRRASISALEAEIARSRRTGEAFSVAILDIDHFKSVNDTYGHAVGDSVLVETARRMKTSVRPYDTVGRFGGEEFLLVFPCLGKGDALAICERIRSAIEKRPYQAGDGGPFFTVTASLGVSSWDETFRGADELLFAADKKLYLAKDGGRNTVIG